MGTNLLCFGIGGFCKIFLILTNFLDFLSLHYTRFWPWEKISAKNKPKTIVFLVRFHIFIFSWLLNYVPPLPIWESFVCYGSKKDVRKREKKLVKKVRNTTNSCNNYILILKKLKRNWSAFFDKKLRRRETRHTFLLNKTCSGSNDTPKSSERGDRREDRSVLFP